MLIFYKTIYSFKIILYCINIEKDERSEKVHNDNEKNEKNIEEENKVNDEKDDTDSLKHRFSIKGRMNRLSDR